MNAPRMRGRMLLAWVALVAPARAVSAEPARHPVPTAHPRLLGSKAEIQALAQARPEAYKRTAAAARQADAGDHERMVSIGLVCAVEGDAKLAREGVALAMKYVRGPIQKGHVTFAHDLARCALVFDLCHDAWTPEERAKFVAYANATVDANVDSETHVFHNGWYGYKHWGIGLACYASYHENERAPKILAALEKDYRERAAPALELAGDGGGWAEGYYIHYWLYEWLFFCEVARRCEGVDYYAAAPAFYRNRAVADLFEMYPGIGEYRSRRPVPMGDGGGRGYGGDRDKSLCARLILAGFYRDDPASAVVQAFNETTPRMSGGTGAYKDLLWRDPAAKQGVLEGFRLSHLSPGAGFVYARSSWAEDATYLFFRCGDRFTAHQHLDVGHFVIYKQAELAGDGGHYDDFGTRHDVNYHLRTIAHNTVLVRDPGETWPAIRAGQVTSNDGGQRHNWPHHNGATADVADWQKNRALYETGEILAFEDPGPYLHVAGDCTGAYQAKKLEHFTRQVVLLRPGTFVIFDRVKSKDPSFKKTWLLQAMKPPTGEAPRLVVTNGKGRLFVETLLPVKAQVKLVQGKDLYAIDGQEYPPSRSTGTAPECRIEVSPPEPAAADCFLHVLTAVDATVEEFPKAAVQVTGGAAVVTVGKARLTFPLGEVGGRIELDGRTAELARKVMREGGVR